MREAVTRVRLELMRSPDWEDALLIISPCRAPQFQSVGVQERPNRSSTNGQVSQGDETKEPNLVAEQSEDHTGT